MTVLTDLGDGGEANFNNSKKQIRLMYLFFFESPGLALLAGAHTDILPIFCWRGRIWVRHCCCVLARCLGKETKSSLLVILPYSIMYWNL